jgi:hypothetical protein
LASQARADADCDYLKRTTKIDPINTTVKGLFETFHRTPHVPAILKKKINAAKNKILNLIGEIKGARKF